MRQDLFLAALRTMEGTPFHHQGRVPHAGLDCIGLIVCAARACGREYETEVPVYGREPDAQQLVEHVRRHADPLALGEEAPGDVVLFCWAPGLPPQHFGVLLEGGRMIHTNAKIGRVRVEPLDGLWRRRVHSFWRLRALEKG